VAAVTDFTYMKKPKTVVATSEQLESALDYIEPLVPESVYNIFAGLVQIKKSSKSDADSAADRNESGEPKVAAASNKPKKKGHGHNPLSAYPGAETVFCQHSEFKKGDICPVCKKGWLNSWTPQVVPRFYLQYAIRLVIYTREVFRCSNRTGCGKLFPAGLPDGAAEQPKYSKGFGTYFASMYYGFGMPMYRMEMWLKLHGILMPDSIQWMLIQAASVPVIATYRALEQCAANGQIAHIDDTAMKVLSLIDSRKDAEIVGKPTLKRIYTSTIAVQVDGHTIVLYYTGREHAGNNLDKILKHRDPTLEPLIQVSDGLAADTSGNKGTVNFLCMVHARRNFFLIKKQFPIECKYVLDAVGQLYLYEADCKDRQLTPLQRMLYHRMFSGPVLQKLKIWLDEQIEQKKTEPNSSLSKAIRYMHKHWEELTQFLHRIDIPIDNNLAERLIGQSILRRNNSDYYKTVNSALVGDAYMSLISTCKQEGVNCYEYLRQLELNEAAVLANPKLWFPSNAYKQLTGRDSELLKPQIALKVPEKIDTSV
jgi:hypothetical protein